MKLLAPLLALLLAAILVYVPPLSESAWHVPALMPQVAAQPVTILMFGDMMLDRSVRDKINTAGAGYLFENISGTLSGHDLVIANAEGVFSDNESISARDHSQLVFTFASSSLPILKSLGFSAFSQANNHALNFGWDSLRQSQAYMRAAGIDTFGDPDNSEPGPLYENLRGTLVAFVGYDEFSANGGNSSSTLAAIGKARENGAFVIVYPHWGEEYNLGTTSLQATLAHKFIDAGADAVVGSHPHVVEPYEIYQGKAIFYSLGNFIFDQHWDDAVSHGLGVELTLDKSSASYRLIPFEINDLQPTPAGTSTTFVLKR